MIGGYIAPLVLRTNDLNASSGNAVSAITLLLLVATDPWPSKAWHCQQPLATKAFLPFSAEAANAAP